MRPIGKVNLFKRLGGELNKRVAPQSAKFADLAAARGGRYGQLFLDEQLPDLDEEEGEGTEVPSPTRGEMLDAAEGLYSVLRCSPHSAGTEAAMAGLGALVGELCGGDDGDDGSGIIGQVDLGALGWDNESPWGNDDLFMGDEEDLFMSSDDDQFGSGYEPRRRR